MTKKQYPCLGRTDKHLPRGQCKICRANGKDKRADATIEIEFTIFRGDDEVYKVHFQKCWIPLGTNDDERVTKFLEVIK